MLYPLKNLTNCQVAFQHVKTVYTPTVNTVSFPPPFSQTLYIVNILNICHYAKAKKKSVSYHWFAFL